LWFLPWRFGCAVSWLRKFLDARVLDARVLGYDRMTRISPRKAPIPPIENPLGKMSPTG
jgi:hypothetical protein